MRELLDRYILHNNLGKGAYGVVLRAYDKVEDENVAIKRVKIKEIDGSRDISQPMLREI